MCNTSIPKWFGGFVVLAIPCIVLAGPRLYVSDTMTDTVTAIDTATNARVGDLMHMTHSRPLAPVVSPDGSRVYVQSVDGPIDIVDAATMRVTKTLDDPNPDSPDGPGAMTIGADGSKLYAAAAGDDSIAVMYTADGPVIAHLAVDAPNLKISALRSSHDSRRLYALDGVDLSITAIETAGGHTIGTVSIPSGGTNDQLSGMAVSLDDGSIYAVTYYGQLVRIDTETMTIVSSVPISSATNANVGAQLYGIALQPDGTRAFVAQSGAACLLDVDLGAPSSASATGISEYNGCFSVAAGRDGKHAYVASYDVANNDYSVVALDPSENGAPAEITGFGYPNFDDQSLDTSGAAITPLAGLWWTPGLPGSSLQIEVQDGTLVVVASTYDDNGAPTWRMASGPFDGINETFDGDFVRYDGGSCLGCAYRAPTGLTPDGGHVTIAFTSADAGSATIGGTTLPIAKYDW
jgi:DNA-binding beta-propeller fold protein YncE